MTWTIQTLTLPTFKTLKANYIRYFFKELKACINHQKLQYTFSDVLLTDQ